ncbi:hypothetical protein DYL61_28210 [Pseudomonas nabeulensis]|uniref:Uncharacterized protein n=1 Tax=Pseudomonas nabeulensis TaxID=2293833 RepID=A0A4Z0AIQ2_9PSED|nr:hypothetical protein DYL61_28210 [Pseudomonas nabeulensis]
MLCTARVLYFSMLVERVPADSVVARVKTDAVSPVLVDKILECRTLYRPFELFEPQTQGRLRRNVQRFVVVPAKQRLMDLDGQFAVCFRDGGTGVRPRLFVLVTGGRGDPMIGALGSRRCRIKGWTTDIVRDWYECVF